jgi:hypothetical protein
MAVFKGFEGVVSIYLEMDSNSRSPSESGCPLNRFGPSRARSPYKLAFGAKVAFTSRLPDSAMCI